MSKSKLTNPPGRLVILLEPEQKEKLQKLFSWGDITPLYRQITADLLDLMKDRDSAMKIYYTYIERKVKLQDITKILGDSNESISTRE